jgi:hypothetical protein
LPNGQWLFLSLIDEHRGRRPDRVTALPKCSKAADTARPGSKA